MKHNLLFLTAATLVTAGFTNAADTPPPPPPAETGSSASVASGKARLLDAGAHHPMAGLMKEVEEKGKVTKEEFINQSKKLAEENFARLDKNNDGVIDKSEIAEIEGKMKGLREKMQERGKGGALREKMQQRGKGDGTRKRPDADQKPNDTKPAA